MKSLLTASESLAGFSGTANEGFIFSTILFVSIGILIVGEIAWFLYARTARVKAQPAYSREEKQFQKLWAVIPVFVLTLLLFTTQRKISASARTETNRASVPASALTLDVGFSK